MYIYLYTHRYTYMHIYTYIYTYIHFLYKFDIDLMQFGYSKPTENVSNMYFTNSTSPSRFLDLGHPNGHGPPVRAVLISRGDTEYTYRYI